MAVELIGLAYNHILAEDFWTSLFSEDLYALVLNDDYRKRIDYRSMRYHTGQMQLLNELEEIVYQGGLGLSLNQLIAKRFLSGVESSPFLSDFMEFDFQVIKYFASLATADDFIYSEKLFKNILSSNGKIQVDEQWTFFDVDNYKVLYESIEAFDYANITQLQEKIDASDGKESVSRWLTHYMEFFHYTYNNHLSPFFYNNTSALKDWGNLLVRHNQRNRDIVKATFKYGERIPKNDMHQQMSKLNLLQVKKTNLSLENKMRTLKEIEYLLEGLDDFDPLVQQKSAESLCGLIDGSEYSELIMKKFDEVDLPIKKELIRSLGKGMSNQVKKFMLKLLKSDENMDVQMLAAYELIKNKDDEVAFELAHKILKGEKHFAILLTFVSNLGVQNKIEKLLTDQSLWKKETSYEELAYVLGFFSSQNSTRALVQLIKNDREDKSVRNALYALNKVDAKLCSDSLSLLSKKNQQIEEAIHIIKH